MPIPTNKLSQVSFASSFNYESVQLSGTLDTFLDGVKRTIAHGLPYSPLAYVWVEWGGLVSLGSQSPYADIQCIYSTDAVNLNVEVNIGNYGTSGAAIKVYYRIYRERVDT